MLSPRAIVAQHKKAAEAAHLATNTRMFDPSKQEAPCLDTATGVEMSMMVLPNSRRQPVSELFMNCATCSGVTVFFTMAEGWLLNCD